MRSFSVETKPLLRESSKSMLWLDYALILLGLINFALYLGFAIAFSTVAGWRANWWRLMILFSFYVVLPIIHHYLFVSDFKNISVVFELSNLVVIMFILTVSLTVVGSCEDGACLSEVLFGSIIVLVFNIVMSSTCVHFYDRLEQLSRVEDDILLSYDVRREKLHHSLLESIEEIIDIKTKFEAIIGLEVFLCVFASLMFYHTKQAVGLVDTVINILLMILLSYRNFLFGSAWNFKLERLESSYHLKFDKVKVRCYGVVVSDRFVLLIFGSFLSFILKDLIVGT
jgi:hypothetical protein